MIGSWKGYYNYDNNKNQQRLACDRTYFSIIITSYDGKKFSGTVKDDILSGGMKETGQIIGEINNTNISFKKLMPQTEFVFKDGSREILNKSHPPIYYSGTLSFNNKQAEGNWKIGWNFYFMLGIIPFPLKPIYGSWCMNLE